MLKILVLEARRLKRYTGNYKRQCKFNFFDYFNGAV